MQKVVDKDKSTKYNTLCQLTNQLTGDKMKLKSGNTYVCQNGYIVHVVRNSLPYYKYSVCGGVATDDQGFTVDCSEVWTEDGIAYHNDCGYNIIAEYVTSQ